MSNADKHIVVWVQKFKDRESLMLQWIDPETGKRKSQSAETSYRPMAEAKANELEYELNHGLHKEASRMSWEKFRELFSAEHVSGLRPGTAKQYRNTFNIFERLCSPTTLRSISTRTVSVFVGKLRTQSGQKGTMKELTIKTKLQYLKAAFEWAVSQKLLTEVPEFPKVRPPKRRPQPVPQESFERLLDKAEDEYVRMFLLSGWLAGLRLNEACSSEWEETEKAPYLDLLGDRIIFPAGFVKAREDQWIPLDPELREGLLRLPRQGRKVFLYKGKECQPRTMENVFARLAHQAGVNLTMRSLRRGFGCYWARRVSAQVLQKLMRHSDIAITMGYYANVDDAVMQAVLQREPSLRNSSRNSAASGEKNLPETDGVNG